MNFNLNKLKRFAVGLTVFTLVTGIGVTLVSYPTISKYNEMAQENMLSINGNTFKKKVDTKILDMNGKLIDEITNNRYEYTTIGNVSPFIKKGYIAVEDKRFLSHNGYDLKALTRASIELVKNKGSIKQGGSTITQQVIKNCILPDIESKWERKILELFLAPKIEKKFTKDSIMEFYVNSNYYGNRCYGIGTASRFYFDKLPSELKPHEAAILIGLSNSPSRYDPIKNPDNALEKRNRILETMLTDGAITQTQYDENVKVPINIKANRGTRNKESFVTSLAVHETTLKFMEKEGFKLRYTFRDQDDEKLYKDLYREEYSKQSDIIREGGYLIYTSVNPKIQSKMEEYGDYILSSYTSKDENGRLELQISSTVVDNKTGMILGVLGGRGENEEYNRAFLSYRQPGSAVKPIGVYAPAFETGKYYPSLVMNDYFNSDMVGFPKNVGNSYFGNISLRQALNQSSNSIPFQILLNEGIPMTLNKFEKLHMNGLTSFENNNYSMAVGGFTRGFTTSDMAKAYATFANNGEYISSKIVNKVVGQDDTIIISPEKQKESVYTPDASYMMLDMMKGVIRNGTGRLANIPGINLAGKTGTTNDDKDSWFCGVTPTVTIATWVGYDNPKPLPSSVVNSTAMLYSKEIIKTSDYSNGSDFIKPPTIVSRNIDGRGNPTGRRTGRTDLFSKIIEDANIAVSKENKEKERLERAKKVEEDIEAFKNYSVFDSSDLVEFDKEYSRLKQELGNVSDDTKRAYLSQDLDNTHNDLNTSFSAVREEYELEKQAETERLAEEKRIKDEEKAEADRLESERKLQEKEDKELEMKTNEDNFLEALNSLRNYQYSSESFDSLLNEAMVRLNKVSQSESYESWLDEINKIESEYNQQQ